MAIPLPGAAARYDYASQRKASDALSDELRGRVLVAHLGSLGAYQVWFVNGPLIRDEVDTDWVEGGNSARYGYQPEGQIWVEGKSNEAGATALHEHDEAVLMAGGMSYDAAHDIATEREKEFRTLYEGRETLSNAKIWLARRLPARGYPPAVVEAARLLQQTPKVVGLAGKAWLMSVAPGYEVQGARNESPEKGWATMMVEGGVRLDLPARLSKVRASVDAANAVRVFRASPFDVEEKPPKELGRLTATATTARVLLHNLKGVEDELDERTINMVASNFTNETPTHARDRLPLVYEKPDGTRTIIEGAHRLAVALLRGERDAPVRLVKIPPPPPPGVKRANLRRFKQGPISKDEPWVQGVFAALGHVAAEAGYPRTDLIAAARVWLVRPESGDQIASAYTSGMLKSGKGVKALLVGITVAANRQDMEAQSKLTVAFDFLKPWVYVKTNWNLNPPGEFAFDRRGAGRGQHGTATAGAGQDEETYLEFVFREEFLQEFFEWVAIEVLKAGSGSEVDWRPAETISEDFYAL